MLGQRFEKMDLSVRTGGFGARSSIVRAIMISSALSAAGCYSGVIGQAAGSGSESGDGSGGDSDDPGVAAACAPETRIWRLNDRQYKNAVRALLPDAPDFELSTPGRPVHEFISWEDEFPIQEAFTAQLSAVADTLAAAAASDLPRLFGDLSECSADPENRECAGAFIDAFVTRAFRRPLAADERDHKLEIFDTGVAHGSGVTSGIESVIATTLQSPSFVYRTELGEGGAPGEEVSLTSYEIAASLSFFLLDSIPDEPLWEAAVDGSLTDPEVRQAQVDRLLALPNVQDHLSHVMLSWVGVPEVLSREKTVEDLDGHVFDDALRQSMLAESQGFVHSVLWDNKTVADLFQSRDAFVDQAMADFYGVSYSPEDDGFVELPPERAGLLARAGLIASRPYGHNHEVFRGRMLREQVLCGTMPPPPADLDVEAFNEKTKGMSTRQRIEVRASDAACGGCHSYMDTLGIAYDSFGGVGQIVSEVNGFPPDPAGSLTGTDVDGEFADLQQLSQMLANSEFVTECIATKMMTYALGRLPETKDDCEDQHIVASTPQTELATIFREIASNPIVYTRIVGGDDT